MLALLQQIGLRDIRAHRVRTLLTVLGIAVGMALPVSVGIVNTSIAKSFDETVAGITGRAVLQVTGSADGFDEGVLDIVRETPGVRVAVPLILGSGFAQGLEGESITVFGVDLLEDGQIRTYREREGIIDDPIAFLNQPDSIVLTTTLAARLEVGLDDPVHLLTVHGLRPLTVRALIDPDGPLVKAFSGNLAVMDVFAAQGAFGKESRFDQIDLIVDEGADPDDVAAALQARLPAGIEVERPEYRSGQVDRMLASFRVMLSSFAFVALLVGAFLLYNTMAITAGQRQREIGTLRALGMSARRVRSLFLCEALILAVGGALLGSAFGLALANVVLRGVIRTISSGFFVNLDVPHLAIPPAQVALALVVGIVTATLAGLAPAVRASRVAPMEAMQRTVVGATRVRVSRTALIAGTILLVSVPGWLALVVSRGGGVYVLLADLALYVGFATLIPLFVLRLVRLLRPACGALLGAEGLLASDGIMRSADRTAVTVAVLSISLSFTIMIGSLAGSFKRSLETWLQQAVPVDFTVSSNHIAAGWLRAPVDDDLGPRLAAVPGVEWVLALRMLQQEVGGRRITIKAMDIEPDCERCGQHAGHLPFEEGDPDKATREVAAGGAVLVSNNFAMHFGTGVGDVLTLPTPHGSEDFRVAGVIVEYTSDQGVVLMNRKDFRAAWRDDLVNYFNVFVGPDADREEVRGAIAQRYGEAYQIRILDSQAQNAEVMDRIDVSFRFVGVVEILAFAIAFLGILNTLLVSTLERGREIGVLRAIGARRRQVLEVVLIEGALIGLAGAVAGVALGAVSSLMWVDVNFKHLLGWVLEYSFATGTAVAAVGMAMVVALLGSFFPAAVAARTNVVRALAAE